MSDTNNFQDEAKQKKLAATSFSEVPEIAVNQRKKTSDYSKPVFMTQVTLHSDQAQQLLEHSFSRVNQALYAATRMMRAQNKMKEAKSAEKQIGEMFDAFSQAINGTILEMEKCITDNTGKTSIELVTYDHKRAFEVAVRTVYSRRLINLFQRIDYLIALADTMELLLICPPDECDNTTKSWCRQFRKFFQAIQAVRTAQVGTS